MNENMMITNRTVTITSYDSDKEFKVVEIN